VPAAFNHLVGIKPTKGRWSTSGLVPACRSLDCVTVLAGTVEDAALVDAVAAGFDEADTYSRDAPPVCHPAEPRGSRVGVPAASQLNFLGDGQSAALFAAAVERVRALGVEIVEVDIASLLSCAQLLYSGPWVAERTHALKDLLATNPGAIHPVVRGIAQGGLPVSAVEAFEGQYRLKKHERDAQALWRAVDTLLLPTCPTAYRIRELLSEPVALNANLGLYTNFVNLLDMSAIALPAGFRDNGTGFGVTFIGPAFADLALQTFARRYEETLDMTPPALDLKDRVPEGVKLAVVGAHLGGMPLHWQLTSRDAALVAHTRTAAAYRLYAMTHSVPPKPALVHVGEGGAAIEVEVYSLGVEAFGSFVAEVPPPLAIGTVTLDDGSEVKGFVAEPRALDGAEDVTGFGGWRAYLASKA
jgi:allophanate hydrolase